MLIKTFDTNKSKINHEHTRTTPSSLGVACLFLEASLILKVSLISIDEADVNEDIEDVTDFVRKIGLEHHVVSQTVVATRGRDDVEQ